MSFCSPVKQKRFGSFILKMFITTSLLQCRPRRPGLRVKVREGSHGKRSTITYGVSRCLSAAGFQNVSLLASHIVSPNFRLPRRQ